MEVRNSVQSPSFGMALKVPNGAKSGLQKIYKEFGPESLADIRVVDDMLKNTKKYHLIMDLDGSSMIETPYGVRLKGGSVSANYKGNGRESVDIYATAQGANATDVFPYRWTLNFPSAERAEAVAATINSTPQGIYRDAYVTRMLDAHDTYSKEVSKLSDKKYADKLISELCGGGFLKRAFSATKEFFKSIFTTNQK